MGNISLVYHQLNGEIDPTNVMCFRGCVDCWVYLFNQLVEKVHTTRSYHHDCLNWSTGQIAIHASHQSKIPDIEAANDAESQIHDHKIRHIRLIK